MLGARSCVFMDCLLISRVFPVVCCMMYYVIYHVIISRNSSRSISKISIS